MSILHINAKKLRYQYLKICKQNLLLLIKNIYYSIGMVGTLCPTIDFVNYISSELDKGNFVVAIYIDLQKAFDVVDHSLQVDKLKKVG